MPPNKPSPKIAILGAGMVGRTIAADLSQNYQVTSIDKSEASLQMLQSKDPGIETIHFDLLETQHYPTLLQDFDYVVCAVPGFMGYQTLEAIISAGKDVADISFFPENAFNLEDLAKEKDVTAIVDCGVAPGMSNLILGYYDTQMKIDSFHCMVGGLPKTRTLPFEYKAPFSPIDVIAEYTRPARLLENGHEVIKEPLTDSELISFEKVGMLESFNTDGLRSLLHTMKHIPNMKEKTLRYPGHIKLIQDLKLAGFFDTEKININGNLISPLEFSSAILFKQWQLVTGEEEFTLMKITMSGKENGQAILINCDLYDEYDVKTQTSSMARTTGYACSAFLNLIINKHFSKKGIFPPELIGAYGNCYQKVMQYLADRNLHYTTRTVKN